MPDAVTPTKTNERPRRSASRNTKEKKQGCAAHPTCENRRIAFSCSPLETASSAPDLSADAEGADAACSLAPRSSAYIVSEDNPNQPIN